MEEIEPILDALGKYPPLEREKIRKIMLSLRDKDTLEANEALELVCACVLAGGALSIQAAKRCQDRPAKAGFGGGQGKAEVWRTVQSGGSGPGNLPVCLGL